MQGKMIFDFDFQSAESYSLFKRIRRLPQYAVSGRSLDVPDLYVDRLGMKPTEPMPIEWTFSNFLFDFQHDIAKRAIEKKCYAVFADCGFGKTLILLECALYCRSIGKRVLIVSPLMVCKQTAEECERFHGFRPEIIRSANLQEWLDTPGPAIGITNYEAIRDDITAGKIGALFLDESSMLKSHYGKFGTRLIEIGRGIEYKLAFTGTPAPNDRIEFANHAVFLDRHRTVNEFLAKYFVNRGQTSNRWELKPHALQPFYRDLSAWCIFLSNPTVYGWKPMPKIPPISIHIEAIPMTDDQNEAVRDLTGQLMTTSTGGIGQRSKLSQIAKGNYKGKQIETNKFLHIRKLIDSWPDESTIIWCRFNDEQEKLAGEFPDAASISGSTPVDVREQMIADFKAGRTKVLISKPKILGFGLNLQVATRQVFSSCDDSYEEFYQAVKRSNRIGSKHPLNVHIAITEIEEPMVENVLQKAHRVEADTKEQEKMFRGCMA
jgi:hypothetical protein